MIDTIDYDDQIEEMKRRREERERAYAIESAKIEKENKRTIVIVIVIVSILVALLSALIAYKILSNNGIYPFGIGAPKAEDTTIQVSSYNADFVSVDDSLTEIRMSDDPLSNRQVYYAGFDDFTVGEGNIVYLENLRENDDIFMAYEIYIGDELIHKTGLIPSGQYSEWIPASDVDAGTYQISIKNVPYYSYNGTDYFVLAYQPVNTVQMTVIK